MIRAAEANVGGVTDKTIVIAGHGPIGNKSQLIEFRAMLVSVRDKVSTLRKVNLVVRKLLPQNPPLTNDAKWGGFVVDGDFFTNWSIKALGKCLRICAIYEEPNP